MKATWFRDPDNTDCPEAPYSIRIHQGEQSAELTRCRTEDNARIVCSALNSMMRDDILASARSLCSIFSGETYAPDEIVGFHPLTQTN